MKQLFIRLALTLPVVWLVVSLVFLLIHLVPGDPIQMMLGEGATPADTDALRHQIGLDQSLSRQYTHYWAGVFRGDLGTSIRLHDSVAHLIAVRYPYTLALTLTSLAIALALALPAGIIAAVRRGRLVDQGLSVISLFGLSVPGLVLGPLLILVFSILLGWFPVSGPAPAAERQESLPSTWFFLPLPWAHPWLRFSPAWCELPCLRNLGRTISAPPVPRVFLKRPLYGDMPCPTRWSRSSPSLACSLALCSPVPSSPKPFQLAGFGQAGGHGHLKPRLRTCSRMFAVDWADLCSR